MRCKLDSTENLLSFEEYPTPPWGGVGYSSNERRFSVESSLQCISSQGGVGYSSNERRFSVESSLQRISSIFFVVETKWFFGSTVNVILTRQTSGQRSSRAVESKRRALGNYFFERICYMFRISKCRGDWDVGLCTTLGLAFGEPMRSGDFQEKKVFQRRTYRILPLRCGSPNASPEVVHRPTSQSPLHFDIGNI